MDRSNTSIGEIVEDIAVLLSELCHSRQDAFHEAASAFTLGSEAATSPDDCAPQASLGTIVRGIYIRHFDECPERTPELQDVFTEPPALLTSESLALFE